TVCRDEAGAQDKDAADGSPDLMSEPDAGDTADARDASDARDGDAADATRDHADGGPPDGSLDGEGPDANVVDANTADANVVDAEDAAPPPYVIQPAFANDFVVDVTGDGLAD